MSRGVLVIGGLIVAGAALALVLLLSGGGSGSDASGTAKTQTSEPSTSQPGPRPTLATGDTPAGVDPASPLAPGNNGAPPVATGSNAPVVTPREQPRGTGTDPTGRQGAPGAVGEGSDYAVGDVRVRDHRAGSNAPVDIPPSVHTPEGPRIDSTLTAKIGQQVQTIMYACAKGTSREGRGPQPRIEGQIVIAVKAKQASVLSSVMQPRDVSAATASAIKSCMEPKVIGLTEAAPNQADLDNYSINLSMKLPWQLRGNRSSSNAPRPGCEEGLSGHQPTSAGGTFRRGHRVVDPVPKTVDARAEGM